MYSSSLKILCAGVSASKHLCVCELEDKMMDLTFPQLDVMNLPTRSVKTLEPWTLHKIVKEKKWNDYTSSSVILWASMQTSF